MSLRFFESFAGSGAASLALEALGHTCVGYSEVDPYKVKNYEANFPGRKNWGDISAINPAELPDFDILVGGTPCTDLSIMKKNREGLQGEKSSLFFEFVRLLNSKLPRYFIFENVRELLRSNEGKDFEAVKKALGEHYFLQHAVLDTKDFGVPQTRRRLYIVGQRYDMGFFFYEFPKPIPLSCTVQDLLEREVDDKYYLTEKMYETVMSTGTKGWYAKPETDLSVARPLTKTMGKMHRASQDNYYHTAYQPEGKTNLRRLLPREAARLHGFPDSYRIAVSDTRAYELFGDAMSVNVVQAVAAALEE